MISTKAGKWACWGDEVGITNALENGIAEFHFVNSDGTTRMRLIELENGNKVETDISYVPFDVLEILDPTDSRIPESRRQQ